MLYAPGEIAKGHFVPFEAVNPSALEMFSMRTLNFVRSLRMEFICPNAVIDKAAMAIMAAKIFRVFMTKISPLLSGFEIAPEDATLIVVVVKLCAARTVLSARKDFGRQKHPDGRRDEINPQRHPNAGPNRRAKRARGIHAHARDWRFKRDVSGDECAGE